MYDRNGTELKVGTFVSEVGSGGLGCVVMVNVNSPESNDLDAICVVAWQADLDSPGGLVTFDPYDLLAIA